MVKTMRIVFMGSPDFAVPCLDCLLAGPHQVVAVVTQPDRRSGRGQKIHFTPVKERALAAGIPVYQPENGNTDEFVQIMSELRPDLAVVVAFGQLLKPQLLQLPALGCINVHASHLPRYRGSAPIHWSIINGEASTGVATMYMDRGMDTGDIILSQEIIIAENDTVGSLHDKLASAGAGLLKETVELIAKGQAPRQIQDHARASYAPLLKKQHEIIQWQGTSRQVYNLVRGMNPWPGAHTLFNDQVLKIWQTEIASSTTPGTPGQIAEVDQQKGIRVECAAGSLWLTEVQLQGSRRMSGADFVRGHRISSGLILGSDKE